MIHANLINYCQTQVLDDPIVCYPDITKSYLVDRALALSASLKEQNIQKAALWFDDSVLFSCVFLACVHARIDVYLPPDFTQENQHWVSECCDILIHDRPLSFQGSARHIASLQDIILRPDALFEEQLALNTREIQIFLKTSGSNGQAKVMIKTITQLQREIETLCSLFSGLPDGPIHAIGSISSQHMYGLTFRIVLSLSMGWIIHPKQCIYPEALFEETANAYPCIWFSSPALLHRTVHNASLSQYKDHIVGMVSSGGALSEEVAHVLRHDMHIPLCEIYGSTETGVIAYRKQELYWHYLPSVVHGEDENHSLWIESPWSGGRQQTADVIQEHKAGFELLGRHDRIIKLEDKRISLSAIEHQLLSHEWIKDTHSAKHPEHTHLAIWVALSPLGIDAWRNQGRKKVIQILKQHLSQTLEKIAIPRYWRFTTALPRNTQSKITHQDFIDAFCQPLSIIDWVDLERKGNEEIIVEGIVPLDLCYFGGHFSEFHLVPGVVEVKWAMAAACQFKLIETRMFSRMEHIKFQQFLRPNDTVKLSLRFDQNKNKLYFKFFEADKVFASGRVVMRLP